MKTKINEVIKFPTNIQELRRVEDTFVQLRRRRPFPNVIGCVDGTHISIPGPAHDNSYYNRKGFHSIVLQGVCDGRQKFLDIFAGYPGSCNDAKVWNESPMGRSLAEGSINLGTYHLLGDKAYPLKTYLLTPYRDNGNLTARHRQFNTILSSTRVVIEQAYGRLKGMFRRLKYCHAYKIENFSNLVMAACMLHNIGIDLGIQEDFNIEEEQEDDEEEENDDVELSGTVKRNEYFIQLTQV